MKKIEAVVISSDVDAVLAGLKRNGIPGGLTLSAVKRRNDGFRSLLTEQRLAETLESGVKLELVVGDREAPKALDVILQCAQLGARRVRRLGCGV
jgi:nitrogen regulatory protein PII